MLKLEDLNTSGHTRWSGGRGYLRRGKKIGGKRFESVMGECASVKL
jgi:hypothetical protein